MIPYFEVQLTVMHTLTQMQQVMAWMIDHDDLADETCVFLGALMVKACRYAQVTLRVINEPDVDHKPLGRRCIFF